ncbi:hypothetical protein C8A01DRAFT_35014 [Parachaetomium inaequale]|uniref:BTB domain-containing protein n=1 Tax=Parachaetomium inaequale TaxID=2588326 RepID=A0AAN6ST06_9PEZI|nr:hypothetical protein C8A01DRAFT_35014 [Parachaetomium inaequale]
MNWIGASWRPRANMSNSRAAGARPGSIPFAVPPRRAIKLQRRAAASRAPANDEGPQKTVVVDPRGDLKLIVGGTKVVYQVCSRTVSRCSPAWDTLLYGPFAEGRGQQKNDNWSIALPADDPNGLEIILHAIHHKHETPPKPMACGLLFQVTVLADKYGMIECLSPFWRGWCCTCKHSFKRPLSKTSPRELIEHLWVYQKLGDAQGFRLAVNILLSRAALNINDELCLHLPRSNTLPYVLSDNVHLESLDILGGLHRAMAASKSEDWYIRRMVRMEHRMTLSPRELLNRLAKIHSEAIRLSRGHANCDPWKQPKSLDNSTFQQLPEVCNLLSRHAEYMKAQAAKSGIDA